MDPRLQSFFDIESSYMKDSMPWNANMTFGGVIYGGGFVFQVFKCVIVATQAHE